MKRFFSYFLFSLWMAWGVSNVSSAEQDMSLLSMLKSSPACTRDVPKGIDSKLYKWPASIEDAYHDDAKAYVQKKMFFCRGDAPETSSVIYIWPSWPFEPREDWHYPIQMVDTAGGLLVMRGREMINDVLLNGNVLIKDIHTANIQQVLREEKSKPEIILVTLDKKDIPNFKNDDANKSLYNLGLSGYYLIDLGVSPPFVSDVSMPIGNDISHQTKQSDLFFQVSAQDPRVDIKKEGGGVYIVSGWTYGRYSDASEVLESPALRQYKYDRNQGMITVVSLPSEKNVK